MVMMKTRDATLLGLTCLLFAAVACAFLLGAEYGVGMAILLTLAIGMGWMGVASHRIAEVAAEAHHAIVHEMPRALVHIPARSSSRATIRKYQRRQQMIDEYLHEAARQIRGSTCECCNSTHHLLKRYPYDPHFHTVDCAVPRAFAEFGTVDLCPWSNLFKAVEPIFLQRLTLSQQLGLCYFVDRTEQQWGVDHPDFYASIGTEYLYLRAQSCDHGELDRLGRRIFKEVEQIRSKEDAQSMDACK